MAWTIPIANSNASTSMGADNFYIARPIVFGGLYGLRRTSN
ncbi:hypothetical protein QO002_003695 [Pararhizobium capsulatum DSM 1112]|uniref:Uncharacterized protein n=1 Tax=Pararhizobium capsulatum DSM 1112 TaxID=1121113 RepID=A0ABU0BUA8_9HYPH|nr:hypothetical protein [Pararhizobium capsulatum DSM 1112]